MRRLLNARAQREEWGEPLLRDWLLEPYYADALAAVTAWLRLSASSLERDPAWQRRPQ